MFDLKSAAERIASHPDVAAPANALKEALLAIDSAEGKKVVNSSVELVLGAVKVAVELTVPPFLKGFVDAAFAFATPAIENAVDAALDAAAK